MLLDPATRIDHFLTTATMLRSPMVRHRFFFFLLCVARFVFLIRMLVSLRRFRPIGQGWRSTKKKLRVKSGVLFLIGKRTSESRGDGEAQKSKVPPTVDDATPVAEESEFGVQKAIRRPSEQ